MLIGMYRVSPLNLFESRPCEPVTAVPTRVSFGAIAQPFTAKGGASNDNEIFSNEARILYQGAIMWRSGTRMNGNVLLLSGATMPALLASDQCDG